MRRIAAALIVGAAITAAIAAATTAQSPGEPAPKRRVWTGTIDDREVGLNYHDTAPIRRPVSYVHDMHVEFTYVSESVPGQPGVERWLSRRITWTAVGSGASAITGTDCESSGSIDLGASDSADAITPEQREQLKLRCKSWSNTPHFTFIMTPPDSVPLPRIRRDMANCESRQWSVHGVDYTQSVAGELDASVEVDEGVHELFVPEPGRTLTVEASSNSGPVKFKFVLDPAGTSAFPGYATNANVDEAFFTRHNLSHLAGSYTNDGPDVIFDRDNLSELQWSRRDPSVVETARAESRIAVTMTTLDYAAVGLMRAYAKTETCGAWQAIPVRIGAQIEPALSIPADKDDNLIADALEDYKGVRSDVDADADPPGNGMHGDGLTAFEEYRGFITEGGSCDDPMQLWHERTKPSEKDLLVTMAPNEGGFGLPLRLFEVATGLRIHTICYQHMIDGLFGERYERGKWTDHPDSRSINFTLQQAGLRTWRGKRISQDEPQRGLIIGDTRWTGDYGSTTPVDSRYMGPPKFTRKVRVWLSNPDPDMVLITVVHEMGHAVGIPHHSDTVAPNWAIEIGNLNVTVPMAPLQRAEADFPHSSTGTVPPADGLVVEPGPECSAQSPDARRANGVFVGCATDRIVRRGQQNSGEYYCPARYRFGKNSFYETLDVWTRYTGTLKLDPREGEGAITVDRWSGPLKRYDMSRESITAFQKFCSAIPGTLINGGTGADNHSGDAGRERSCLEHMVVNDVLARGVPR